MEEHIRTIQIMLDGLYEGGDVSEAARSSLQYAINMAQEALNMPDVSGSFSAEDMEEAYNDGAGINKPREFDINNYR
jgi:hypothetical protein